MSRVRGSTRGVPDANDTRPRQRGARPRRPRRSAAATRCWPAQAMHRGRGWIPRGRDVPRWPSASRGRAGASSPSPTTPRTTCGTSSCPAGRAATRPGSSASRATGRPTRRATRCGRTRRTGSRSWGGAVTVRAIAGLVALNVELRVARALAALGAPRVPRWQDVACGSPGSAPARRRRVRGRLDGAPRRRRPVRRDRARRVARRSRVAARASAGRLLRGAAVPHGLGRGPGLTPIAARDRRRRSRSSASSSRRSSAPRGCRASRRSTPGRSGCRRR